MGPKNSQLYRYLISLNIFPVTLFTFSFNYNMTLDPDPNWAKIKGSGSKFNEQYLNPQHYLTHNIGTVPARKKSKKFKILFSCR